MVNLIADIKKDIQTILPPAAAKLPWTHNSIRNKILSEANKELIYLYFRIGKVISENQKYGSNFINMLSTSLKIEYPDAVGFPQEA